MTKDLEKQRDELCYEIFEKEFPANSRMPGGDKWSIEKSSSLRIAHASFNAAVKLLAGESAEQFKELLACGKEFDAKDDYIKELEEKCAELEISLTDSNRLGDFFAIETGYAKAENLKLKADLARAVEFITMLEDECDPYERYPSQSYGKECANFLNSLKLGEFPDRIIRKGDRKTSVPRSEITKAAKSTTCESKLPRKGSSCDENSGNTK